MKKRVFCFLFAIILSFLYSYPTNLAYAQFTNIVNPYEAITYSKMLEYINNLEKNFDDLVDVEVIGKSLDQRDIILVKVGKGDTLIHINGSMHARERIATNIILKNIEDYCNAYVNYSSISGYNVRDILDKVTIYYVPMVNPDGVDYTILGKESIRDPYLKATIDSIYRSPQAGWNHSSNNWKANIGGVDLNRQWDSDWDKNLKYDPGKPANAFYKGSTPLSEPEAKAIYQLTIDNPFVIHVAYHTQGKIFYWCKNQKGNLLNQSINISKKITALTGFNPVPSLNYNSYFESNAGYTDWTVDELKKPGFTMEFASNPYTEKDFDSIYKPAKALGLLFAQEAYNLRFSYNTDVYVDNKLTQVFENEEDARAFIAKYTNQDSAIKIVKNGNILYSNEPFSHENILTISNDFVSHMYNYNYQNNNDEWKELLSQYIPETGLYINHELVSVDDLINKREKEKVVVTASFSSDSNSISKDLNNIYTIKGKIDYTYSSKNNKEENLSKSIILSIYIDEQSNPYILSIVEEDI